MRPSSDRSRRRITAVAGLFLVAAGVWLCRRPLRELRIAVELHRALTVANVTELTALPLCSRSGTAVDWLSRVLHPPREAGRLADRLYTVARESNSDVATQAASVALLLRGDGAGAAARLGTIPEQRRDAAIWSNMAAMHAVEALRSRDREHVLAAIFAADQAIDQPTPPVEARFVRARVVDALGAAPAAEVAWGDYLRLDETSKHAALGRRRLAVLSRAHAAAAWKTATATLAAVSPRDLARLATLYPEQARRHAESLYVTDWAAAVRAGDHERAAVHLAAIRTIGQTVYDRAGDDFLLDVADSLDVAAGSDEARRSSIVEALLLYRKGRIAISVWAPSEALSPLEYARDSFAMTLPSMAMQAECYVAIALIDLNQMGQGRERLVRLTEDLRRQSPRNQALLAFALYHLALIAAIQGSWSESLQWAEESAGISTRLSERGFIANAETLMSEAHGFIGQQERAWMYGLRAIENASVAGDHIRLRVALAVLGRAELRRRQPRAAKTLIGIERVVARSMPSARDDTEMFLRLATADAWSGNALASRHALALARRAAKSIKDLELRSRLTADADGVEGALTRRTDPARAVGLLSAAIDFQLRGDRRIVLPQLYLERGRAYVALRALDRASNDFERGIATLERQRSRTFDAELRTGIFDDAAELFREAISLALSRGNVERAFRDLGRGRARALLEEMNSREIPSTARGLRLDHIAEAVPRDGVLLEYVLLEHRVAIFVIDVHGLRVKLVNIAPARIVREAAAFVAALIERRAAAEVKARAANLFEILLAPVRDDWHRTRQVIVVADPALQQVPFAALFDRGQQQYFVEQRAVINSPSAAIHALSTSRLAGFGSRRIESGAVFANPASGELPNLPWSEREAATVARNYPDPSVFSGARATVEHFERAAPAADLIHFAGHTLVRMREPWNSALLFAPSATRRRTLSVREIAAAAYPRTRIAVLASCSTLQGRSGAIEGVPSVARAFLVAGVPSVIGTLWDVSDSEASAFMRALHRGIAGESSPAEALRQAQLLALGGRIADLRHPGHWAAFALLGAGGG
jgi:CHAT domain-containing protein